MTARISLPQARPTWRRRAIEVARDCVKIIARHKIAWGLGALGPLVLIPFIGIHITVTESMPGHVYLILKHAAIRKGDVIEYRWHGGGPYPAGTLMLKYLAGVPGDLVTVAGRTYAINGVPMGMAKTHSRKGLVLDGGPMGRIPAGRYYVFAPHPDSLDSRYALTGWIAAGQFVGRAYEIF